jgi:ABC-type enterochelin transport system permease subunit
MDINFSIGRIVLLTYIILASSYCSNLFSHGLKQAIESNRMVQHLILLILIMTLMIIFGNPFGLQLTYNDQFNTIIMSLLVYVWFIMTTKLDLAWNVSILIILTMYFLYESKKISDYQVILADPNLDSNKKKELFDSFNDLQKYLLVTIFGVTLAGTYFYVNEKQVQYGGGFNLYNFFFY